MQTPAPPALLATTTALPPPDQTARPPVTTCASSSPKWLLCPISRARDSNTCSRYHSQMLPLPPKETEAVQALTLVPSHLPPPAAGRVNHSGPASRGRGPRLCLLRSTAWEALFYVITVWSFLIWFVLPRTCAVNSLMEKKSPFWISILDHDIVFGKKFKICLLSPSRHQNSL